MIERLQLLRNFGQFDSVDAGGQLPFRKLTLIYAENGRGKTTLAAALRSVSANDPRLVSERQRLGAAHPPHIVLNFADGPSVFQNGAWSAARPRVTVFDDAFVAANVCSGIEIGAAHRQNLHELILGAQGVSLNATLQGHVERIEAHNRALSQKERAIPPAARGSLSVDAFCALSPDPNIESSITTAERNLAAAQSADAIRSTAEFMPLALPAFDVARIEDILSRTLPDLEAAAAAHVREHLRGLGRGGEAWVGEGLKRLQPDAQACPFCAQDLVGSPLIAHYQAYFSEAYEELKTAITRVGQGVNQQHGGEVQAAFERAVRLAAQTRDFWRAFAEVPEIDLDTAAVVRAWTSAREAVLPVLRGKAGAPLERTTLPAEGLELIRAYDAERARVEALSNSLGAINPQIAIVKEQAATANVATLQADLARLRAVQARHSEPVAALAEDYLDEKAAKATTEELRGQARAALNHYRNSIFPTYEAAINTYLQRFGAGFRLGAFNSVNTRGGSSCNYNVVINTHPVPAMESFRSTLSAGDRNTLALGFFFATLDQDPGLAQKILVIDDPMTSLDENRTLTTIQQIRQMVGRVSQVILLSHAKAFLCDVWSGADKADAAALAIRRIGDGSTLAAWDVTEDSITEHDRRHALVMDYIRAADPATERRVAEALRPMLEAYLRVAYPAACPPGTMLGSFLDRSEQRLGQPDQIINQADIEALQLLRPYVNRFHHDTNPAWQTAAINDHELTDCCRRVLRFIERP